jgi:hypothetical protein
VKGLRTTLSKTTHLQTCSNTRVSRQSEAEPGEAQQAINERKESSGRITAQDHHALAGLLGDGDVESGYFRLSCLNEGDADVLARRYRRDRLSKTDLLAEVARMEENIGRPD